MHSRVFIIVFVLFFPVLKTEARWYNPLIGEFGCVGHHFSDRPTLKNFVYFAKQKYNDKALEIALREASELVMEISKQADTELRRMRHIQMNLAATRRSSSASPSCGQERYALESHCQDLKATLKATRDKIVDSLIEGYGKEIQDWRHLCDGLWAEQAYVNSEEYKIRQARLRHCTYGGSEVVSCEYGFNYRTGQFRPMIPSYPVGWHWYTPLLILDAMW